MSISTERVGRTSRNEHKAIRAVVEALARRLEGEPDVQSSRRCLEGLEALGRQLAEHFAREEAPAGIFAMALAEAPRLERRVLAVRQQHEPLGAEIQEIITDAGYAGLAPEAWRAVAERFRGFAKSLRHHERAEDRILCDAYLSDLGSGD
jgi:hypothetical protein